MREKALTFLTKGLLIMSISLSAIFFVSNMVFNVNISYNKYELVTIKYSFVTGIIISAILAIMFIGLKSFRYKLEKVSEKKLFICLSIVYSIMAAYLILNIDPTLRADALSVSYSAKQLLMGNLDVFYKGAYLYRYPHQTGLVIYDALLYLFSQNVVINFIANFLFVLGTNYLFYKISDLVFHDHLTNIITIFFAFGFLPQFFFIVFAYGNIPSFFFLLLAFYHALKFTDTPDPFNMIIVLLGCVISVLLRKNCIIGVIAIITFLLLNMIKKYTHRHLTLLILLIIGITIPPNMLSNYFFEKVNIDKAGAPTVLWIAMGTDIDNNELGPGWYNAYNFRTFNKVDYNPDISHQLGVEKLKDNLQKIKNKPEQAMVFFAKKTVSQWCEPLYQSIWSGPLAGENQHTHTRILQSLYGGGRVENILALYCKAYTIGLWLLSALFLTKTKSDYYGWELMFTYLIGGFLFHIFWEAKSQYVYQYFAVIIPFSAYALSFMMKSGLDGLHLSKYRHPFSIVKKTVK